MTVAVWNLNHAHRFSTAIERLQNECSVASAGSVAVGQHNHIGTGQARGVSVQPLASTTWITGRAQSHCSQRIDVFLTFHDKNGAALGNSL